MEWICIMYCIYIYIYIFMYLVGNAINFDDKVISKCNSKKEGLGRLLIWGTIPPDLES